MRPRRRKPLTAAQEAVRSHLEACFGAPRVSVAPCPDETALTRLPHLRLASVAAGGEQPYGVYVTLGCWDVVNDGDHGLEFAILGDPLDARRHLLRLAMLAYYHANPDDPTFRMDVGHTVALGEPWLPGSTLDSLLVSLPYPLGPDFEICDWAGGHARLLWLLPITSAEREYRHAHDLEALEERFDEAGIDFVDPSRPSVV